MHVAAFVTSHGFGHAARASAVLEALHARRPELTVDLYTAVPESFLRSSLRVPYRRVELASDPGMVQRGPFRADMAATERAIFAFAAGLDAAADGLAKRLRDTGCDLVLCDIDAVGILAAEQAGVPSVLVENFRWDWIYRELPEGSAALRASAARIGEVYRRVDLHVQVAPACDRVDRAEQVDAPIARAARSTRVEARAALGVGEDARVVLVTTGGVPAEPAALTRYFDHPDVTFLLTGAARTTRLRNVACFAHEEPLYLPDLVRASDAVVAKIGYSTVAETWRESRPLLGVPRSEWPEGPVLAAWTAAHLRGFEASELDFASGAWLERVGELLALPGGAPRPRAGQDEVAERVLARFG